MNILQVLVSMPPAAGTTAFCVGLSSALDMGGRHSIRIATRDVVRAKDLLRDLTMTCITLKEAWRSMLPCADWVPDVIHIHGLWAPVLHFLAARAYSCSIPVVWSPHGMLAPWALKYKWYKKALYWHLCQRRDVARATVIHVTSDLEASWVRTLGFSNPLAIVPLGVEVPQKPAEARENILLYVGRIHPVKGLENAIRAWGAIDHAGWKFVFVGPDEDGYVEILQEVSRIVGVDRDVVFLGARFGHELAGLYERCACVILPSFSENFGSTVIEGMSHSCPIIASRGTPWKLIEKYGCGWWVENSIEKLAEAIVDMIRRSSVERLAMGRRGRKVIEEQYSWSAVGEKMMQSYKEIVK